MPQLYCPGFRSEISLISIGMLHSVPPPLTMEAMMESRFGMGPFVFLTNPKVVCPAPFTIYSIYNLLDSIYNLTRPTHPKIGVFFQMGPEIQSCDWWTQKKRSHPRSGLLSIGTKRPYCFPDPKSNTIKHKGWAPS